VNIVVVFPCLMIVVFVWNCSPLVSYHLICMLLFSIMYFEVTLFGDAPFFFPTDSMFLSRIILMVTPLSDASRSWLIILPFESMKVAMSMESPCFVSLIFSINFSAIAPSARYRIEIFPDSFSLICFVNCSIDLSEMFAVIFSRL